jgi:hypothetical protein
VAKFQRSGGVKTTISIISQSFLLDRERLALDVAVLPARMLQRRALWPHTVHRAQARSMSLDARPGPSDDERRERHWRVVHARRDTSGAVDPEPAGRPVQLAQGCDGP